jgi:hypothetical protein
LGTCVRWRRRLENLVRKSVSTGSLRSGHLKTWIQSSGLLGQLGQRHQSGSILWKDKYVMGSRIPCTSSLIIVVCHFKFRLRLVPWALQITDCMVRSLHWSPWQNPNYNRRGQRPPARLVKIKMAFAKASTSSWILRPVRKWFDDEVTQSMKYECGTWSWWHCSQFLLRTF